ncbi:MAG: hypothetical protein HYX68_02010 [Planctomycetes bacterium]|nr:hypothetical protein [Planctomycetota bacterium]
MAITVLCSCGKRLRFKDEFAGKRAKCPYCHEPVMVPTASGATEEVVDADRDEAEEDEKPEQTEKDRRRSKEKQGKKKKRRKSGGIGVWFGWLSPSALFGDMTILGIKPGCILLAIVIVAGVALTAYFAVPGLGPRTYYTVDPVRDDPFTAPSGIHVTIYNTDLGKIEEQLIIGTVRRDPKSGIGTVFYKTSVIRKATRNAGDKNVTFEIHWTDDSGLSSVLYNGKRVPRSVFRAAEDYRAVRGP